MSTSDFLLRSAPVTRQGASPARWMLILHGILGSGGNFRSVARRLAEKCPSWGFLLPDLRGHGLSLDPPPPHTLKSAAEDLITLGRSLSLPIAGVIGHSFGGKVAITYAGLRAGELEQLWVLDAGAGASVEGARLSSTSDVLRMLEEMPDRLPSRERFFEIAAANGLDKGTAEWLAMNIRRDGDSDGFRLRVDLRVIRALMDDYFNRDLWPIIETPGVAGRVDVVLGGRSTSVPEDDKERYRALGYARGARSASAQSFGAVEVHELPRAGHWVHVDDPEGLLALLEPALSR